MNFNSLLCFLSLLFIGNYAHAQSQSVSGIVKDDKGIPLPSATVSLLKAADSSWVQSQLTDDNGAYLFEQVASGNYIMDVQALGYASKKFETTVEDKALSLDLAIAKQANTLKEVTVSAVRPLIETEPGKIIVNIGSSMSGTGSNALDVLRKAPGVKIDQNGNISIQGKQGVMVMIDERPTYLEGEALTNYLRSLPSDDIAQVELITQPSAKYDAEGNAGIINFKQKKNQKEGVNGNLALSVSQGIYPATRNSAGINYKKGKLNLYANASYFISYGFLRSHRDRQLLDENKNVVTTVSEDVFMKELFSDWLLKTGADYKLSDKTTTGILLTGNYHPNTQDDISTQLITDKTTGSVITNEAVHPRGFLRHRAFANAYLKHNFKEGHDLNVNADALYNHSKERQFLNNVSRDEQLNVLPGTLTLKSWVPTVTDAYSLKADYTGKLNEKLKMEAGVKSSYTQVDNDARYEVYVNDNWVNDVERTNRFVYTENINAAYVNLNADLGKKWKTQLGLRAENANIEGVQSVNNSSFTRHTTSLFPSAFASYAINEKNQVELNAGRRIERPWYNWLNPFPVLISQYTYQVGNPNLLPQFSTNCELSHVYDGKITTRVFYNHVPSATTTLLKRSSTNEKAAYSITENLGESQSGGLSLSATRKLMEWWALTVMAYGYYGEYSDGQTETAGTGYYLSADSQFVFKNGWRGELHLSYSGRSRESSVSRSQGASYNSCGVSKSILKDSGTLRLNIEDPFMVYRYNSVMETDEVYSAATHQYNTFAARLSFTYNFGKKFEARQRDNNMDEARRL